MAAADPARPVAAVLTISDGVAAGVRDDDTGAALAQRLADDGYHLGAREVVADESDEITAAITRLADQARLVVTNGGTGLGPRDVTPEATASVLDREVPGLAEAMRAAGRATTPMADLSRGLVGAVGASLVLNLPGSPSGAVQSFEAVRATLGHALALLAGDTAHPSSNDEPGHHHAPGHHHGHGHDRHDDQHRFDHGSAPSPPADGASSPAAVGDVEAHAELARRVAHGQAVVLATAVRTEGQPPCAPGMAVLVGGEPTTARALAGTLGCAELDEAAVADAPAALAAGSPRLARYDHAEGSVEVQLQPFTPAAPLIVLGATPVAAVLLRWAGELGWTPVLVESRRDRVDAAMRAAAAQVVDHVDALSFDERSVAVHTDHDAPDVAEQLAALLRRDVRRIELMGSRRHASPALEALGEAGLDAAAQERIHRPAGLDLGGRSPAEIAVAILAGLVADRHGRAAT